MILKRNSIMKSKLKKKRIQQGLLQVELAHRAGVYPSTLSRFEMGWIIPKASTAVKIAKALDCEASDLFDIKEKNN
jgi:DNA-binding XRE family transcriptional regulator